MQRWGKARLIIYGFLVGCLVVGTSSWWLPRVLPRILRQVDLEVARVEQTSEGNWRMWDVRYGTETVGVRGGDVEIPSVLGYLWARFVAKDMGIVVVRVDRLEVNLKEGKGRAGDERGLMEDPATWIGAKRRMVERMGPWLPEVEVGMFSLRAVDEKILLKGRELRLSEGNLRGQLESPELPERLWVEARMGEEDWGVEVEAPEAGLSFSGRLSEGEGRVRIEGVLGRGMDRIEGHVIYVEGERLPIEGEVKTEGFALEEGWLPRKENWRLVDARLGKLFILWEKGRYAGQLASKAVFVGETGGPIPLEVEIALNGNMERIEIEKCAISAGWGQVQLSEPVTVGLQDYRVDQDTRLTVVIDLAKQPFMEAKGKIEATLSVTGTTAFEAAAVQIKLRGKGLEYQQFKAEQLEGKGVYRGTELDVSELWIRPSKGDVVELSGTSDIATGGLNWNYVVDVGADQVNEWLGEVLFAGRISGEGRVGGEVDCPEVEGVIDSMTYESTWADPIEIAGRFYLTGKEAIEGTVRMKSGEALIETVFEGQLIAGMMAVELEGLRWTDPEHPELVLEKPVGIRYFYGQTEIPLEERISIEPFHILGTDLEMKGEWGAGKGLVLLMNNVSLLRLNRWVKEDLSAYTLKTVEVVVSEWKPYLEGTVQLLVESEVGEGARFGLKLESRFGGSGFQVEGLTVEFAGERMLEGAIVLPLRFEVPTVESRYWGFVDGGQLEGKVTGATNRRFSEWLNETTGIQVGKGELDLEIEGRLESPVGRMKLQIDSIESGMFSMPKLKEIVIEATAESGVIEVSHFGFNTEGENAATGRLSLPVKELIAAITGTEEGRKELYAQSSGTVVLKEWKMENWVDQLPTIMRQSGALSGSFELRPGLDLRGALVFEGFALRPTPTFPSIDQIEGEVVLADRTFTVKRASARVLESTVEFEGWLNAEDKEALLWDFGLKGANVPLVRTTDMILRSDLDIRVTREDASSAPLVSGDLKLGSSTLLVAFDPLAPSVESGPKRKPPFFAIREPTIADWRFEVKMSGDSFMRVRSPYFKTELSADLRLGGTFGEPELVGSVRTVNGELRFPGSRMSIESGEAYITPERLDAMQLDIRGTTQKASYVVTMEVTQTLDDPHVSFQSSPALPNASIIRLLATGSTTGGGVGTVGLYLGQGFLGAGGMDDSYTDRLTIDVGAETSRSGRSTVGARFELTDDVYLNGEYDIYDAYNLDLVWSIFRK